MKQIRLAVFVAALALGCIPRTCLGQCKSGPASPRLPTGLSLNIRVDIHVAQIGSPVVVHAELSNHSNITISVSDHWWPALDYELHLRDAAGREVPLTDWGHRMRTGPIHGSQNTVSLSPGGKDEADQDLSKSYAIPLAGSYTLEACREVNGWGNIYSNKLIIPFVQPLPATKQPEQKQK
jgi:hypothetical protein